MAKDNVFDEIARVLASPMPRRQALRRIIGGLTGAALATVAWYGPAQAADTCSSPDGSSCGKDRLCCGGVCCDPNRACCAGNCCSNAGWECCGNTVCCPPGQCKNGVCKGNPSPS